MLHAARHNQEFSLLQPNLPVPKLHAKPAAHDQEQLVLGLMMMPDEFPLKADQLYLLSVQLTDYLGTPLIGEPRKRLCELDFVHGTLPVRQEIWRTNAASCHCKIEGCPKRYRTWPRDKWTRWSAMCATWPALLRQSRPTGICWSGLP